MSTHPEFGAEQAYIERAYLRLEEIRAEAEARAGSHAAQRQTGLQAAFERDVVVQNALERARTLDIGDQSLVFARIDMESEDRWYIGRRAVYDDHHSPLVIDWRVPSAEPFYRATGRHPMGLRMRRHFLCEGRALVAIEDEQFGSGAELGLSDTLVSALERPRTGHMRDIVATVQAEQDEIIRDGLEGVLAVQGGPGTGKTAVGLHRAAFLLFTYREKLERQGMLVIGPNRRFLRYIDQVLPALGENGVTLATLGDLAPRVALTYEESSDVARIKGDPRMARIIAAAAAEHQRTPASDVNLSIDGVRVVLTRKEIAKLVKLGRRNRRSHNARRSMLANILIDRAFRRYRSALKRKHGAMFEEYLLARRAVGDQLRSGRAFMSMMNEVWPLLTPQELVKSQPFLAAVNEAFGVALPADIDQWSFSDLPLLDEARFVLGAPTERRVVVSRHDDMTDDFERYGHIIVDEAQDLTPMALRMIARRSRMGSITLVGDLAQAVGPTPPASWDEVLSHLPSPNGVRHRELTVNYRTPGSIMSVAASVLAAAHPSLSPPRSARDGGEPLGLVSGDPIETAAKLAVAHEAGTLAIIAPRSLVDDVRSATGIEPDDELRAVLTPHEAKGLEFDDVVIVEPARIVAESAQGLRALYVALTRATQRATVAYGEALPDVLTSSLDETSS